MSWLDWLFSLGRVGREPKDHTAGRAMRPASAQRTQLGLAEADLTRGVVTLRSGEVRAFLQVAGYSAHLRSPEDARAWLQGYARALSTLPGGAVLIVRSRPGGLQGHIARQRAHGADLAQRAPGSALAKLAADQLGHARRLQESGQVRQTDQYLALHSPKGDVARLLAAVEAVRRHLAAADVRAELVTDAKLGDALAVGWRPETGAYETSSVDWEWPGGSGDVFAVLTYSPKNAKVTEPRCVDPPADPPRRADVREVAGRNGKALPR